MNYFWFSITRSHEKFREFSTSLLELRESNFCTVPWWFRQIRWKISFSTYSKLWKFSEINSTEKIKLNCVRKRILSKFNLNRLENKKTDSRKKSVSYFEKVINILNQTIFSYKNRQLKKRINYEDQVSIPAGKSHKIPSWNSY